MEKNLSAISQDTNDSDATNDKTNVEKYIKDADAITTYLCSTTRTWGYYNDLHSCALLGLVQAQESFNPKLCESFSIYAKRKMYQSVVDEMRKIFPAGKGVASFHRKVAQIKNEFKKSFEYNASFEDLYVAEKLEMTLEEYYRLKNKPIDRLIQTDHVEGFDIEAESEALLDKHLYAELLTNLGKDSKTAVLVVKEMYENGLSQLEVAELLGISNHSVGRLHARAMKSFRMVLSVKGAKKQTRKKKATC